MKIKRTLLGFLPWLIFQLRRREIDFSKNILIIALGRGGSTWISNLFSDSKTICLFEPFSDLLARGEFQKPFYAGTLEQKEKLLREITERLNGKHLPISSFLDVSIRNVLFGTKLVYKTVNLHFILDELLECNSKNSKFEPIAVIRNPLDVIMSERNLRQSARKEFVGNYRSKLRIGPGHPLSEFNGLIENAKDETEVRLIELLCRYKQFDSRKGVKVFDFDEIIQNSEILKETVHTYTGNFFDKEKFVKPSRSTLKSQKQDWRSIYSTSDLMRFSNVTEKMNYTKYSFIDG